jgi:hypothetical protein
MFIINKEILNKFLLSRLRSVDPDGGYKRNGYLSGLRRDFKKRSTPPEADWGKWRGGEIRVRVIEPNLPVFMEKDRNPCRGESRS